MDCDITVAIHNLMCSGIIHATKILLEIPEISSLDNEVLLNESIRSRGHNVLHVLEMEYFKPVAL